MPVLIISRIVSLLIILSAVFPVVAQESYENDTVRARKYLSARGEVYFSFEVSLPELRRIGRIVSVDNYVDGRAWAYAGISEFETFLEESLTFIVYSPPGEWHVKEPKVKGLWDFYPSYTEYTQMMEKWSGDYPDICEYIEAGTSVEGRKILFMKITGNKTASSPKPRFMYSSTMHGDETVGYILMLRLIEYLLENYPHNPQVEQLLDNLEIWINPLANPDGTYFGGDGNQVVSPKRFNANDKDLNRNFPVPGTEHTAVGREPETVAMMELMESKQFILSANLHGGAEVMNYPWDWWERRHADDRWFTYICREYADTAMLYSPPDYMTFLGGVTNGWDWYSISGGRQDYVTYFTGGREVTMEISNIKHPSPSALPQYWDYNRRSLLSYMEQAMFGIRGNVRDAVTGEPLRARLELLSHDRDSSHAWTEIKEGWYFRLLEQGTYDLEVSAKGYHSRVYEDIYVGNRSISRLDVQLTSIEGESEPGRDSILNIFPVPVSGIMNIYINLPISSMVRIALYDLSGKKAGLLHQEWIEEGGIYIEVETGNIPPGVYILNMTYGKSAVSRRVVVYR